MVVGLDEKRAGGLAGESMSYMSSLSEEFAFLPFGSSRRSSIGRAGIAVAQWSGRWCFPIIERCAGFCAAGRRCGDV